MDRRVEIAIVPCPAPAPPPNAVLGVAVDVELEGRVMVASCSAMAATGSTEIPRTISPPAAVAGTLVVSVIASSSAPPPTLPATASRLNLKTAEGFSFAMAPRSLKSPVSDPLPGPGGRRMYTAAAVSGGRIASGRRKTTRWLNKGGLVGSVKVYWDEDIVARFVCTVEHLVSWWMY